MQQNALLPKQSILDHNRHQGKKPSSYNYTKVTMLELLFTVAGFSVRLYLAGN